MLSKRIVFGLLPCADRHDGTRPEPFKPPPSRLVCLFISRAQRALDLPLGAFS